MSRPCKLTRFQLCRVSEIWSPLQLGRRSASRSRRVNQCLRVEALDCREVEGCWVISPSRQKPKAVVHFLGGVFAGAAPTVTYSLFIELLAEAGYLTIATPFRATLFHSACAATVHQRFEACLASLRRSAESWLAPLEAPIFGIGHSNGALLHLLIGSMHRLEKRRANVIISYNNMQVSNAIPLPLDGVQSVVQAARSQAANFNPPGLVNVLQRTAATASSLGIAVDQQLVQALTPAVDQLETVFGEIGDGNLDFSPSPEESMRIISQQYSVPSTLFISFSNDSIDETAQLLPVMRRNNVAGLVDTMLPGSHVTPCGADLKWQVGRSFSLVDAFGVGVKAVIQADIRRLASRTIAWLDRQTGP